MVGFRAFLFFQIFESLAGNSVHFEISKISKVSHVTHRESTTKIDFTNESQNLCSIKNEEHGYKSRWWRLMQVTSFDLLSFLNFWHLELGKLGFEFG